MCEVGLMVWEWVCVCEVGLSVWLDCVHIPLYVHLSMYMHTHVCKYVHAYAYVAKMPSGTLASKNVWKTLLQAALSDLHIQACPTHSSPCPSPSDY